MNEAEHRAGSTATIVDDEWVRARLSSSDVSLTEVPLPAAVERLVRERSPLLDDSGVLTAVGELVASIEGVLPLRSLLDDPSVTDVLVNGPGAVWIERGGHLERTEVVMSSADCSVLLERAFQRSGRSIDRAHPIGDTRLADGTRVSAVLSPLSMCGPTVALRRPSSSRIPLTAFGSGGVVTALADAVVAARNILVFGATGAGKTTLLSALTSMVPSDQRIITIEDAAELRLDHPHVVALECHPENGDGRGRVTLRELVAASLRLRPDRLVLGEVRGPEALDMVWALASGHRGSFATCHAASAAGALERLETFVAMGDSGLPHSVVRAQVRAAFDLVVGVARTPSGRRVVSLDRVVTEPGHPLGTRTVWADR